MEKETFFQCVACCSSNGVLKMERNALDAAIAERELALYGVSGVEYYVGRLSLADFCLEQGRHSEAMDHYLYVFSGVMRDKALRCGSRKRESLRLMAFEGLKRLCCSPMEVVWEICSQLTSDYMELYPDW